MSFVSNWKKHAAFLRNEFVWKDIEMSCYFFWITTDTCTLLGHIWIASSFLAQHQLYQIAIGGEKRSTVAWIFFSVVVICQFRSMVGRNTTQKHKVYPRDI